MGIWEEYGGFFRALRQDFHHTGAILPSSRFLGRAMTRQLRGPRPACRILEVGPGTGPITREIARWLVPGDRLEAVEINPQFVALLRRRVERDKVLAAHREAITIIEAPVEKLPGEGVYDFIISGLPLNNFSIPQIRAVFIAFRRLLKPDGLLTYFEYPFVRRLKVPFVNRSERRRLSRVGWVVGRYIRNYQVRRERVLLNVPPAIVRHLRFTPGRAPCENRSQALSS
jgi:phospholipid N-methyltransferase